MFIYTSKYVHILESPKPLFVGCNNHLVWHGWCALTKLFFVSSLPIFPILTHKYLYFHSRVHPPRLNGMRLVFTLIVWSFWHWSSHSTPLRESDSWQYYCWPKMAMVYAANPLFVYVNFNGDPKALPFVVFVLNDMTVPLSHILRWVLLLKLSVSLTFV